MKSLILRQDNFISADKCQALIERFKTKYHFSKKFRDTIILGFRDDDVLKHIAETFTFYPFKNIDNMEIVKWPTGSKMALHRDEGDTFSWIIYLNDDFEGGETVIDGIKIQPKIGRLVLFSNGFYEHEVTEITKGTRYTLIAWYK
tara:strand:+ start:70 stop:504 length:435 start_codon:yes stop_codon:yes gene_type:complete